MDGLLSICDQDGIDVCYVPLTRHKGILGWYRPAEDDEPPMILLDESLPDNPPLERTVLAEEVGHHHTVPTGSLARSHVVPVFNGLNRSNCYRDEGRAVRWAAKYLMPTMELAVAAREGCHTVAQLAERFNCTEWIVHRRRRILREDLRKSQGLRVGVRELFVPILVDGLWGLDADVSGEFTSQFRPEAVHKLCNHF